MRVFKVILLLLITVAFIIFLDCSWGSKIPAFGRLLDPVNGAMAAAEITDHDFGGEKVLTGLKAPVQVWYDHRLVPHIRAENDYDLYYAQGFITASFRLWQMDLQTRAAGGRVSEILGPKAIEHDRAQRRKGMMYAAENSVRAMENDPRTKTMLDAYRDGINSYIASLNFRRLPLEYKLMGFQPERWTNLRTALLLKYMADDLTGYTEDIPLTYLRDRLSKEDFELLYPLKIPGSKHVVPAGTPHPKASMAVPPVPGDEDSLFAHFGTSDKRNTISTDSESGKGSNSWVISPKLTASGAAILCNDPHLSLNLPSLWFEVQLQAPGVNVYGVSLPGAPGVVIGFNDSVSWGMTNNYRDVKDYYEIHPADADHYWFDGGEKPFHKRVEKIGVKGGGKVLDTVLYTVHGPVQYDAEHPSPDTNGRMLAMCWMAHRPTNELLAVYKWNRATDVTSFREAISHFECPAQNFAYADRAGNYAQFTQGRYTNKWPGQGRFVMRGSTSKTLWGADIPMEENPFALNHPQGYLVAANQSTTDDAYPYWYNGSFSEERSWRIYEVLYPYNRYDAVPHVKIGVHRVAGPTYQRGKPATRSCDDCNEIDMTEMQTDVRPYDPYSLITLLDEKAGLHQPDDDWDPAYMDYSAGSKVAPIYQMWYRFLQENLWKSPQGISAILVPSFTRTKQLILADTSLSFARGFNHENSTSLHTLAKQILHQIRDSPMLADGSTNIEWYRFKNTHINHLTKIPAFGFGPLKVGGWGTTINANKVNEKGQAYGPSWRMIVEMDRDSIRAYGHYPGGQSGNVGSRWYANMLNDWVEGKYNRLLFFLAGVAPDKKDVMYSLTLKPAE